MFEAICAVAAEELGIVDALEWVSYALLDVTVDAWRSCVREANEKKTKIEVAKARFPLLKAEKERQPKKKTKWLPETSVMGSERHRARTRPWLTRFGSDGDYTKRPCQTSSGGRTPSSRARAQAA